MSETPKKRVGRPRKNQAEKAEQFSIRLSPPHKIMLEMMARDKNLSLSQTVQHLVTEVAGNYTVDGKTLVDTLYDKMAEANRAIVEIEEKFKVPMPEMQSLAKQTALFNSRFSTIFLMPERLLEPDELALVRACFAAQKLPPDDELAILYADSKTMMSFGSSVDKTTEYLVGLLSSKS